MQKLIQLNPGAASAGKLDTSEVDALLAAGWTVATDMCAAADGAVLIVLDAPEAKKPPADDTPS